MNVRCDSCGHFMNAVGVAENILQRAKRTGYFCNNCGSTCLVFENADHPPEVVHHPTLDAGNDELAAMLFARRRHWMARQKGNPARPS